LAVAWGPIERVLEKPAYTALRFFEDFGVLRRILGVFQREVDD
jgi:hypothetical protein